jgi:pimeloyl-ACP methyl ester carboxylesterase
MRIEWGADNPAIRQLFAASLMPDATKQQIDSFNELQRRTTSAECAARYLEATGNFDVVGLLPQVRAPTLVMHARGDAQIPMELGRQLAAGIPEPSSSPCRGTTTSYWNRTRRRTGSSKK